MKKMIFFSIMCFLILSCINVNSLKKKAPRDQNDLLVLPLVDSRATAETISLFAYLKEQAGQGIMFGHQHETTVALSVKPALDNSDTREAVGDFAAVYGWDTLSIVDDKQEGDIVEHVKAAYKRGGIITISSHLPNVTSGGNSWDRTLSVPYILPGGKDNPQFREDLDTLADWALAMKDENGTPIPMIMRLFHENTGSWFWWGAAYCSAEEYIALFRYTVEYLRDVRGVHNFLYAYSPNLGFRNESTYLERYPGDAYVDVIGFDAYGPAENNAAWMSQLVEEAAVVVRMAEKRGKIAAIAEIGIRADDLAQYEYDDDWYTTILNGLKAHPEAKKISYMLAWANFRSDHYWVPYIGSQNAMLEDFKAFYKDPYSLFNKDLSGVYNKKMKVTPPEPSAYILIPVAYQKQQGRCLIYAKVSNAPEVTKVSFQLNSQSPSLELKKQAESLYYSGEIDTTLFPEDETVTGVLTVTYNKGMTLRDQVVFIVNNEKDKRTLNLIDNFDGYSGLNRLLEQAYVTVGDKSTISLKKEQGQDNDYTLVWKYDLADQTYTGINHALESADWSRAKALRFRLEPETYNKQRFVVQIIADGVAWESYRILGHRDKRITTRDITADYGNDTVIPEVTGPGLVEMPFSQFILAPWEKPQENDINLSAVTTISFYVNIFDQGTFIPGNILYVDDIELVPSF